MPKRLIGVGECPSFSDVCLDEDVSDVAPYLAVTHIWRLSVPNPSVSNLTKDNISHRSQNIPRDILSPTIQDAVKITRFIGVRHIWIDSLCILQDSSADRHEQSAQMANVYENALFTISCESDKDSSVDDGAHLHRKRLYEIPGRDSSGNASSIFVQPKFKHDYDKSDPGLLQRGWCIQERVLSQRLIRFRPCEVLFECAMSRRCEHDEWATMTTDTMTNSMKHFVGINGGYGGGRSREFGVGPGMLRTGLVRHDPDVMSNRGIRIE